MNKNLVIAAFLILIIINSLWIITNSSQQNKGQLSAFVSIFDFLFHDATTIAQLFVQVVVNPPIITIQSPQNTTYYFNLSQPFNIDLNVSATFVGVIQTWWYTLYNASNTIIYNNIIFTPNTSFVAVNGGNKIAVYVNLTTGVVGNANVTFTAKVSSSTPQIENLSGSILVCEESFLSYTFNITDADDEVVSVAMTPVNPFFITKLSQTGNRTTAEIFSGIIAKSQVGNYSENVSASDGVRADSKNTNITAVPINHAPLIETVGVQTIWFNDNLYRQINANDTEDGNVTGGNLTYNLTFISGASIFTINTTRGIINYTANNSTVGNYNISICVIDRGLNTTIYPNATYCGYSGSPSYNCTNFQLTITNQNRQPNITSWYPQSLSLNATESANYTFNVSANDPDETTPDAYWYVNNILEKSISNWFNRTFTGGNYNVTVRVTDGELNASKSWFLIIGSIPRTSQTGGGGGGGGKCEERWGCDETASCQDPAQLYKQKLLDDATRGVINTKCRILGWGEKECGIKILDCKDVNKCGTTAKRPSLTDSCYFVENPSCNDKVKNCHDNSCEVLVDCGGPCGQCPTCNDKTQNQGEEGIDCGGPCPNTCPRELPKKSNYLVYLLIIMITILIIAISYTLYRLFIIKKKIEEVQ